MERRMSLLGAVPPCAGPPGATSPAVPVVNFMINFSTFGNYCGVNHGPEEVHGRLAPQ